MPASLRLVVLVSLFLPACWSTAAKTYYVSLAGDNTNRGTTEKAAFRTIKKGVSVLKAGDTLTIKSGNYGDDRAVVQARGTERSPITIMAEKPGEVVLRGNGKGRGLSMTDKSHIVVDGLKFVNFTGGIGISGKSSFITVRRCIFVNNQHQGLLLRGIKKMPTASHHHVFTGNQFLDYAETGPGSPTSGSGISDYGLQMYFATDVKATSNYFYGHHHQCLSFKKLVSNSIAADNIFDGFYYSAIYLGQNDDTDDEGNLRCNNLIAEGNVFRPSRKYRAKRAVCIANVSDAIVRNNLIDSLNGDHTAIQIAPNSTGAKVYGNVIIGVTKEPAIEAATSDCEIFNNTIAWCDTGLAIIKGANPLVRNNIFYRNKKQVVFLRTRKYQHGKQDHSSRLLPDAKHVWTWQPDHAGRPVFEHNDFFPRWDGMGRTDISADPKFTGQFERLKPSGPNPRFVPDFKRARACRLRPGSPCIDRGAKTSLPFTGKAPDIGAFDFGAEAQKEPRNL